MKRKKSRPRKLPIWLSRLALVKEELRGIHWPSVQGGLNQGIILMAFGIGALKGRTKRELASFSRADRRWVTQWSIERGRIFS